MQPSDPYSEIKQEVENELLHATHLRSNLFAGNSAHAAAEQLAYQLQNVTEQLSALEAAVMRMIDHPERFQLDAGSAYARQLEVEKLRWQLQDLQATCAHVEISTNTNSFKELSLSGEVEMNRVAGGTSSLSPGASVMSGSNSKPTQQGGEQALSRGKQGLSSSISSSAARALPTSTKASYDFAGGQQLHPSQTTQPAATTGPSRSGWDSADWDLYEDAVQQQMIDQDHTLDHISVHVDRIKQTGQAMHEELEEQSLLLGGLQEDTDSSQLRLRSLRRQVQDVIRRSRTDRQLCWILLLSVLLLVVTLAALA